VLRNHTLQIDIYLLTRQICNYPTSEFGVVPLCVGVCLFVCGIVSVCVCLLTGRQNGKFSMFFLLIPPFYVRCVFLCLTMLYFISIFSQNVFDITRIFPGVIFVRFSSGSVCYNACVRNDFS